MANNRSENNLVTVTKYIVPALTTITSLALTIYYQQSLILTILIPLSIFLLQSLTIILVELRNSRQEIRSIRESISPRRFNRYRDRWLSRHDYRRDEYLYFDLENWIGDLEYRYDIELSYSARELLILPVLEEFQRNEEKIDFGLLRESLEIIVKTIKEEPAAFDTDRSLKSSQSVIKSYWKNFCNIPPFCTRND